MIDRATWIKRCAARLRAVDGCEPWFADLRAETLSGEQAELYGESGMAWDSPENAADRDVADGLDDE